MRNLLVGLLMVGVVLGGLVAWDKHKRAVAKAAYEKLVLDQNQARHAVADKHRGPATQKLARIDQAIAEAKAAPRITARTRPAQLPPLKLVERYSPGGNTLFAGVAQPASIEVALAPRYQAAVTRYLDQPVGASSSDTTTADGVEHLFQELDALSYGLLVRVHEATPPSASNLDRFVGGRASGDAMLYDLATGKILGAFPFALAQRDTATVTKGQSDVDAQLLQSFAVDIASAIKAELRAWLDDKPGLATAADADAQALARFGPKIRTALGLSYLMADIHTIDVTRGPSGPIVTFHAEQPKMLMPGGHVAADLQAIVKQTLGTDAEIRAVTP